MNPVIARLTANGDDVKQNPFLSDVLDRYNRWGKLSDKQIEAIERAFARHDESKINAEKGIKAPSGRVTLVGTVVSVKDRESRYNRGTESKCTVRAETGWLCWFTLPDGITRSCVGQKIRLTATVTPSDRDPSFGFGARPHGVELLS